MLRIAFQIGAMMRNVKSRWPVSSVGRKNSTGRQKGIKKMSLVKRGSGPVGLQYLKKKLIEIR